MGNKKISKLLLIGKKISGDNISGAKMLAIATVTISGAILVLRNVEKITQSVDTPLDVLFFLVGYGFLAFIAIVFLAVVYSSIGDVVGKYLIWTFEEEKEHPLRLFSVMNDKDDVQKGYSYKQLAVSSVDLEKIEGCYIVMSELFMVSDENTRNRMGIGAKEFLWARSSPNVPNNRLDLVRGNPVNLYVARVSKTKNIAEIVGINDYNTKIEKGTYFLRSMIFCKDFPARTFYFYLIYDGKKELELKNISSVSAVEFFTFDIRSKIRLFFRPKFIAKVFRFLKH